MVKWHVAESENGGSKRNLRFFEQCSNFFPGTSQFYTLSQEGKRLDGVINHLSRLLYDCQVYFGIGVIGADEIYI